MELPSYPDFDQLPQRMPLNRALDISSDLLTACQGVAVAALKLSVRPMNCLANSRILRLEALLSLSISDLYAIPSMGRGSIVEIVKRLCDFVANREIQGNSRSSIAAPVDTTLQWYSLDLRDEWNLFSCGANAMLPISLLSLPVELSERLQQLQVAWLDDLLGWTWDEARAKLGEDEADQLLSMLVATAQEHRNPKVTVAEEGTTSRERRACLLAKRWGRVSTAHCGLEAHTRSLVAAARITNLAQLQEALDPLIPALCFDLPVFCDIWNRLMDLGLRHGDPFAEWERQLNDATPSLTLDVVIAAMKQVCKTKEWKVLDGRYGFFRSDDIPDSASLVEAEAKRRTLEEVATILDITRERVRQVESAALRRLQAVDTGAWLSIASTLHCLMWDAGGVYSLKDAARELTQRIPAGSVNAESLCYLLFELSDRFAPIYRGKIYCLVSIPTNRYSLVIGRALEICKQSAINLQEEEVAQQVHQSVIADGLSIDLPFIAACLQADGRFSSDLSRRDLSFHLLETLRRIGKPAHYTEIAKYLNAAGWRRYETSEKSVNSRLGGERDLFVYLERGVYGLAEWGMEDRRVFDRHKNGYIGDHIETLLTQRDEPLPVAEIIAYVLSQKRCQEFSIQMSLSRDGRFHSFGQGRYGLKKWVE